jgi:hypothetical protein
MRELTVRIRFIKPALGNVKQPKTGRFVMPRNPVTGAVTFLASWHRSNMQFASQLLGRHQDEVKKILWDLNVDGVVLPNGWYRRYYTVSGTTKERHVLHESFRPGQVVGINCVVPAGIPDDDFWELMRIAGQYKGLSPARPDEFGRFEVESIRPRRAAQPGEGLKEKGPGRTPTSPTPLR